MSLPQPFQYQGSTRALAALILRYSPAGIALLLSTGTLRAAEVGAFSPQLMTFSAAKEQQVRQMARELHVPVPTVVSNFFKSATGRDYVAVTNTIEQLGPQFLASFKDTNSVPSWIPFW